MHQPTHRHSGPAFSTFPRSDWWRTSALEVPDLRNWSFFGPGFSVFGYARAAPARCMVRTRARLRSADRGIQHTSQQPCHGVSLPLPASCATHVPCSNRGLVQQPAQPVRTSASIPCSDMACSLPINPDRCHPLGLGGPSSPRGFPLMRSMLADQRTASASPSCRRGIWPIRVSRRHAPALPAVGKPSSPQVALHGVTRRKIFEHLALFGSAQERHRLYYRLVSSFSFSVQERPQQKQP